MGLIVAGLILYILVNSAIAFWALKDYRRQPSSLQKNVRYTSFIFHAGYGWAKCNHESCEDEIKLPFRIFALKKISLVNAIYIAIVCLLVYLNIAMDIRSYNENNIRNLNETKDIFHNLFFGGIGLLRSAYALIVALALFVISTIILVVLPYLAAKVMERRLESIST
jgi:hypothetical protein